MSVNAAVTATVTEPVGLNIRKEPSASSEKVGSLAYGTQVSILSTQTIDGYIWGQIDNGWIRLDFTDYQASSTPSSPGGSSNWKHENGNWYYYKDGQMVTGWVQEAGLWYYMDSSGVMRTGWTMVNGRWFYMNESGVMQTGWLQLGATHYYLNSSGAMQTGWIKLNNNWYYLHSNGAMAVGKVMIGERASKFDLNGVWLGYTQNAFSPDAMALLKLEEGFSVKPYWDYSQWTVGYGTKCPDDMLSYYQTNGISQADAELLLRKHMSEIEAEIDQFISGNGLTLSQGQYDAVVLFSYNCGTSWIAETTGTFHNVIKNQATGNDLIRGFALWCSAGGEVKDFLVRRRLSEANIYLNGEYSQTPPENFCFVMYDANGGEVSPKSQGYDALLAAEPFPVPTHSQYAFDGWYTAKTGGTKVTVLETAHNNTTLYARWVGASDTPVAPVVTPDPVKITVTNGPVNVRKGPGTDYDRQDIKVVQQGEKLTLVEYAIGKIGDTATGPWGRFTEYGGGWVCLNYTDYETVKQQITAGKWLDKGGKKYYYLGIEPQFGWIKHDNQWYYTNASGEMVTGWIQIGNNWYYLKSDGIMAVGWLQVGEKWYYMTPGGTMVTGWLRLGDRWYYFRPGGSMVTGWLQSGNTWYYLKFNGGMVTGWEKINGVWYYFRSGGAMATGWVKDGNHWYFMSGGGKMVTGWLQLSGKWYYMESNGVMVTGEKNIGPVTHIFDADGVWLGQK